MGKWISLDGLASAGPSHFWLAFSIALAVLSFQASVSNPVIEDFERDQVAVRIVVPLGQRL